MIKSLPPFLNSRTLLSSSPHLWIYESTSLNTSTNPSTHRPCPVSASTFILGSGTLYLSPKSKSKLFCFCLPSFTKHHPLPPSIPGFWRSSSSREASVDHQENSPKSAEWRAEKGHYSVDETASFQSYLETIFLCPWVRQFPIFAFPPPPPCLKWGLIFSKLQDCKSQMRSQKTHKAGDSTSELLKCFILCLVPFPEHNTLPMRQGTKWWSMGPEPDT